MTAWTDDELVRIGAAEELTIAPLRSDGTLHKPVIIWAVRVGNALYVRPVFGRASAWFQSAQMRHAGRIQAGGVEQDVNFVETDGEINDAIDAAYRSKYRHCEARDVDAIVNDTARAATIELTPR